MKYIDVFKKSLAEELKKRGHVVFKTRKNLKNPKYDVYVFKNINGLEKDFNELK